MLQLNGQANAVNIYGARDWVHVKEFVRIMIHRANGEHQDHNDTEPEPIELDLDQHISLWRLDTKYYETLLEIKHHTHLNEHEGLEALATVILWESKDKDNLVSILRSFSKISSESRLLIVRIDAQSLEDDHEWHEICIQNGFDCHSFSDLDEASMSWQCCAWPRIKMKNQNSTNMKDKLITGKDFMFETESKQENDKETTTEWKEGNDQEGKVVESEAGGGFEDDFSGFVSAETSSTEWDYKKLPCEEEEEEEEEEEDIDVNQVEMMVRRIFSQDDELEDVECLVSRIDQLRIEAASLDLRSRQRFAANVALAVQSGLGWDE